FLRSKVFLSGDREPSPGFYGSVIRYHNHLLSAYVTDFYNYPTTGATSVLLIHPFARKGSDFDAVSVFVQQIIDALTSGHFAFCMKFFYSFLTSTKLYFCEFFT